MNNEQKDEQLWKTAKARVAFKSSLASYLIVNLMLNAIWYFTSGVDSYYWPIWPALGWGVGLAFQYFHAYHGDKIFSTESEYERLKNINK